MKDGRRTHVCSRVSHVASELIDGNRVTVCGETGANVLCGDYASETKLCPARASKA